MGLEIYELSQEDIEERIRGVTSGCIELEGCCNRARGGKCKTKAYMKSLGYDNVKIVQKKEEYVWFPGWGTSEKWEFPNLPKGCMIYTTNYFTMYGVLIEDSKKAQDFERLLHTEQIKITIGANACCAKCKYHSHSGR